jgi:hypothetical protein
MTFVDRHNVIQTLTTTATGLSLDAPFARSVE